MIPCFRARRANRHSENTRLAVVARNALNGISGEVTAADVERQVEAGKLSLADLNALAYKGGEISKGALSLVFGSDNSQDEYQILEALDRAMLIGDRFGLWLDDLYFQCNGKGNGCRCGKIDATGIPARVRNRPFWVSTFMLLFENIT